MVCIRSRGVLAFVALVLSLPHTRAGLYSPHEVTLFPVRADGTAEALMFGTQTAGPFRQELVRLLNVGDPNPGRTQNPDRRAVLERIAARKATRDPLPPVEAAALAADLLRVGRADEAVNLLHPLSRGRNPDFRVLANLAHVHAFRGEWQQALDVQGLVLDFDELPRDLAHTTPEQRRWLRKVERTEYPQWLRIHRQRADAKLPPELEDVFPLFPVKFVNDAGVYEPGTLAAAERKKLPADAVAVVQQLVLWAPWDTGLYWLLAELYAAEGMLREAAVIFDQCADSRQYSNRPIFMAHRLAVRDAAAKLPPEKSVDDLITIADSPPPPPEEGKFLPSRSSVILGSAAFGAVAVLLLGLQVWVILRRRARRSAS